MGRKRSSSSALKLDSDSECDNPSWRRQYESGRKRRRNVDRGDKLELLVYKLAERDANAIESDIERLSEVLLADMVDHQSKIIELLLTCVLAVPERMTIYSTLVGVLNARNSSFGAGFLQRLWTELHRCLSRGRFTQVHRIVRFVCDLLNSKVITAESLLNFLGTLINAASEGNGERRSDFFIYIVLSSMPWCGKQLHECRPQAVSQLISSINQYIHDEKRQKIYLPLLQVWSSSEPHLQEDYLDSLSEQIKQLVEDEWVESQILRPYQAFDSVLCDATSHSFPQLELLTADEEESNEIIYPLPRVVFRMFDYTDVPDDFILPGAHSIERYLIEEQLSAIIDTYHLERKECAMYLLNHQVVRNIPLDYMIVEVIFGHLFTLPVPPHIELFYGSLLIELCKMKPSTLPQVLAQATELIFDRLPTMKAICIERYISWFTYNLSNFQLRWSWDYWSYVIGGGENADDPEKIEELSKISSFDREVKVNFIKEVMQKLIRFSYHSALIQTTPECFHQFVPPKMVPNYKYAAIKESPVPSEDGNEDDVRPVEQSGEQLLAARVRQAMQDKAITAEIQQILQEASRTLHLDSADPDCLLDVFFSTLLYLGSKTFSHTYAALVKYHSILRSLVASDEQKQLKLLNCAYSVWSCHHQMMVFLVDKLLRAQIVDSAAVATWIFSREMQSDLLTMYVWEILHNTIRFECARAAKQSDEEKNQQGDQIKNLFLTILQRMVVVISEYMDQCEQKGEDPLATVWYNWVSQRLQAVLLSFYREIRGFVNTLEALIFTPDVQFPLLEIFQQFCSVIA